MTDVVVIMAALALGALVKGITGMGLPVVAVPVMASFLGPQRAVVVMAVPTVLANGWLLWHHRSHWRGDRDVYTLLAGGAVGAVVGTWLLRELDSALLSVALALLVFVYVGRFLSSARLTVPTGARPVTSPVVGLGSGLLQGTMGVSGPLLATYVHALHLHRERFVAVLVSLFCAFSSVQVVALASTGLLTSARLGESAAAVLPMAAALVVGTRLAPRVPQGTYDWLIMVVLLVSAVRLLATGLASLS